MFVTIFGGPGDALESMEVGRDTTEASSGPSQASAGGSPDDHLTSCICGWEFCLRYLAIFRMCNQTGGDDLDALRGGPCFKINISGSGEKQVKWRECVLSNLLVSEKVQERVGKEPDERVRVAPHHYSLATLRYFASGNHKKSTPVTWQQARAIQDPFDEEDKIKTSKGTHYFLAPNYPEHLVHISAESDSRCKEHTLNRTASNLEREEAQRQQEFDQLTLQQKEAKNNAYILQSKLEASKDRVKELESRERERGHSK